MKKVEEFPWSLELALSGGGHRATAYALGALLYLVHAKLNHNVRNIASVSGASITNAFVASRCDYTEVDIAEFRKVATELIAKLETQGLLSVRATWLAIGSVVALTIAILLGISWLWWTFVSNSPFLDVTGGFMLLLILLSIPLALRGWAIDRWMAAVYFGPRRTSQRMKDISNRGVDHVFCATDLGSALPFFFSSHFGGRQVSPFYGLGRQYGPFVPIQTAVRASSAFPPAIPPILHVPGQFFLKHDTDGEYTSEDGPPHIWLTDGGAYNNFGTEWHAMRRQVYELDREYARKETDDPELLRLLSLQSRAGFGEIQLIVDASQVERWQHYPAIIMPIGDVVRYIFRTMSIMYGSTLSGRSRDAHAATFARMKRYPSRWRMTDKPDENEQSAEDRALEWWNDGALQIYIPYSEPLDAIHKSWAIRPRISPGSQTRWDNYATDRKAAAAELGKDLVPDQIEVVPTTFRSLKNGEVLRLVVAGYLNIREGIYGAFDYLPEKIPARQWFEELSTFTRDIRG